MSVEEAALDNIIMCSGTSTSDSDDDMNQKLNDITVVNILMDLGPSCTYNAATFRDALRLATQKIHLSGKGGPLKEEEIARLFHFFAAVGARKARLIYFLSRMGASEDGDDNSCYRSV